MRKTKTAILCALIISILATGVAYAANYDSSTDPLVTLSYLNDVFMPKISEQISGFSSTVSQINDRVTKLESGGVTSAQLTTIQKNVTTLETKLSSLETKLSGIETKYNDLQKKYNDLLDKVESGGSAIYQVVFLNKGETILTPTGCELILRSGTAVIVSPFDSQGLSDTTDGLDLLNNFAVPSNHNLIVPRGGDGRGIKITSDVGAYVMVRGGYTVVKP